jgi:RimJ/RimL family protein N-acetyltransferase
VHQFLPLSRGVLLRDHLASDAEVLGEIEYDDRVKEEKPEAAREDWIRNFRRNFDTFDSSSVVSLPHNVLVGRAGLHRVPTFDGRVCRDPPYVYELMIFIGFEHWGNGLGRITAELLIDAAFRVLTARAVIAVVNPENSAAVRLVKCLGFRYHSEKPASAQVHWQDGHHIYVREGQV